jgi:transcriptional regulator with GAF, ATPase, and Fis domain
MSINESEFFREMTLRICGSLDIDHALSQAFEYMREHIPIDAMGLGYNNLDEKHIDKARIFVVAKAARKGARYIWKDESMEIALSDEVVEYTRSLPTDYPTTIAINRPGDSPPFMHEVFPGLASNSAIFLRLRVHGGIPGVLLISVEGHDRYSPEHTRLLDTIREPFAIAMTNARRYRELVRMKDLLAEDNRALQTDIKRTIGVEVIGADFGLREVMEQVRKVAPSNSPTLLLGETGTGKEIIANAIHMASPRSKGPMISMQCGAIPDTLLDVELFGHEKGAFTGAVERKRGRFERANGGTLFLDEIGELSQEAQVKLLRVLQERRFERVGGTKTIEVDVRVIVATHRDLDKMVREGTFREDLWYRLNVLPIRIPPLRLRREDIPSLVQYFVERKAREMNLQHTPHFSSRDLDRLKAYDWPGNVRELQNIVERALILSRGERLRFPDLSTNHQAPGNLNKALTTTPLRTMDEAIADHIRAVLDRVEWQVAGSGGAAEILQMNPSTLRFRMKKLGVKKERQV